MTKLVSQLTGYRLFVVTDETEMKRNGRRSPSVLGWLKDIFGVPIFESSDMGFVRGRSSCQDDLATNVGAVNSLTSVNWT